MLINDKITVLLDRDYVLQKGNYNPALNVGKKDFYKVKQSVYIIENSTPTIIKMNKKSILEAVSPYQNQINTFVNTRKLDYKKTADVVEILREYNSLLKLKE